MPGVEANTLSYISAHSADVILSDIRPIKLKPDALRAINVLLDEFLFKILTTAASLSTEKLRAGLLSLLPTSLGKEALLEAEVELRAYWERADSKTLPEDDTRSFHLQWAFELLRLKCEAYSTLNEQDENPNLERQVAERFAKKHPYPPSVTLVDPAALYLTAILESMCEHILSNVGRVAARDSSRTSATVNDLFVALCEDDSIYGFFRTLRVYEQIEMMANAPKFRRSRSFSRTDRQVMPRTSTPQQDPTQANSASGSRSRQSSEGQIHSPSQSSSRVSFEKSKALKMFGGGKSDREEHQTHKKTDSFRSEGSSHFVEDDNPGSAEDAAMLREFDDLMRSTSTMKVSLTPDRLKTMEVYKQEKERNKRHPTHFPSNSVPDVPITRSHIPKSPSIAGVNPIAEVEEDSGTPKPRPRQASVTSPSSSPTVPPASSRTRSISTSSAGNLFSKPQRSQSAKAAPPSSFTPHKVPSVDMSKPPRHLPQPKGAEPSPFPPRKRTRARNRDSFDLDDVMNGSDDEQQPSVKSTPSSKRSNPPHAVSASTRELMDFLAEGPPETKMSKNGRELVDFLSEGPPDYISSAISLESPKQKPGGRLQRMISKLSLGNGEKAKGASDAPKTPTSKHFSTPSLQHKASNGTLAPLANRPIPPRPPKLPSPPTPTRLSIDESYVPPSRTPQPVSSPTRREPATNGSPRIPPPAMSPSTASFKEKQDKMPNRASPPVNGNGKIPHDPKIDTQPVIPVRTTSHPAVIRKVVPSLTSMNVPVAALSAPSQFTPPVPALVPVAVAPVSAPAPAPPSPTLPLPDVVSMQRLMSNATTADECRLIFDMFMARNGIAQDLVKATNEAYPPPTLAMKATPKLSVQALESSLVELFLTGSCPLSAPPSKQRKQDANQVDAVVPKTNGTVPLSRSTTATPSSAVPSPVPSFSSPTPVPTMNTA